MTASTEPRGGLEYGWDPGEDGWGPSMNANLLRLSRVGFHPSVISKSTTAPPGSPVSGEGYVVPSGATGAWSGQSGKIAIWDGAAWAYIAPRDGFLVHVADADGLALYDGGAWSADVLRSDRLATAYAHSQATGNPHSTTAAQIGALAADNPDFVGALKQGGVTRITSGGGAWLASVQATNLVGAGDRPVAADLTGTLQPKTPDQFRNMISALAASLKGAANGVAELGADVKIPVAQLPSAALLALGETPSTAHRGDHGVIAYNHSQAAGNPHGTTAADVGAMPAPIQITGAINFNSINGGAPGIYRLEGSSYTNAPGGATSTTTYSLWQGVSGGRITQVLVDGWYGGTLHREQLGAYTNHWSEWAEIWDSTAVPISLFAKSLLDDADATAARTTLNAAVKPSVGTQAGNWTLGTSTPTGTRQTGSGTLTLPAASATYAGLSYTITATTDLTLTIAGTFCYLDPNNSASYWYDTSTSVTFAMNGGHASGVRKKIEIYCDGAEWLVKC